MKSQILFFFILTSGSFVYSQNYQWALGMCPGNYIHYSWSIQLDENRNVYTTGNVSDLTDFDPGPGTYYADTELDNGAFISKLDSSGNFIWAVTFDYSDGKELYIDAEGNAYLTGCFSKTTDFDPGPDSLILTPVGYYEDGGWMYYADDIFVVKVDPSGNLLWVKTIEGSSTDESGLTITGDSEGNIYVGGFFDDTADFDPGPDIYNLIGAGEQDCFILKLSEDGNFINAWSMGGQYTDIAASIVVDNNDNLIVTGISADTVDFDPGPGIFNLIGGSSMFLAKYDPEGGLLWAFCLDTTFYSSGLSVDVDDEGNIYTVSNVNGAFDFDPGPGEYIITPIGYQDMSISKFTTDGIFSWVKIFGGKVYDGITSVKISNDGNIFCAGLFNDTADFDPGPDIFLLNTEVAAPNAFILNLDGEGNFLWAKVFESKQENEILSITVDEFENVYATGFFEATTDFNPGPDEANINPFVTGRLFVLKLGPAEIVNIEDLNNSVNINIYPNPVNETLVVELNETNNNDFIMEMTDVQGRIIHSFNLQNANGLFEIPVADLIPSMYFLKITDMHSGETNTSQFIKQ